MPDLTHQYIAPDAGALDDETLQRKLREVFTCLPCDGKRTLFIIPDHTRSMPLPAVLPCTLFDALHGTAPSKMDIPHRPPARTHP